MCSSFIAKADVLFSSLPQQQKQALLASSACDTISPVDKTFRSAAAVVFEVAPSQGLVVLSADPPGNPCEGGGSFTVPLQLSGILTVYTVPLTLFHPIRTHTIKQKAYDADKLLVMMLTNVTFDIQSLPQLPGSWVLTVNPAMGVKRLEKS